MARFRIVFVHMLVLICMTVSLKAQSPDRYIQDVYKVDTNTGKSSYRAPIMEAINIRSSVRGWELDRQDYSIRFNTKGRAERRAETRLIHLWNKELTDIERKHRAERAQAMHEAYVEMYVTSQELHDLSTEVDVLEDVVKVESVLAERDPEKWLDVIRTKEKIQSIKHKQELLTSKLNSTGARYFPSLSNTDSLFLDIDSYLHAMDASTFSPYMPTSTVSEQRALDIVDKEIDRERAQLQKVFDFAEVRYRGPHSDPWQEKWSVGMSANIPVNVKRNFSLAKLKVEKEKIRLENRVDMKERQAEINEILSQLKHAVHAYRLKITSSNDLQTEKERLIKMLTKEGRITPLVDLQHRLQIVSDRRSERELLARCLELYIDYLDESRRYYKPMSFVTRAE